MLAEIWDRFMSVATELFNLSWDSNGIAHVPVAVAIGALSMLLWAWTMMFTDARRRRRGMVVVVVVYIMAIGVWALEHLELKSMATGL